MTGLGRTVSATISPNSIARSKFTIIALVVFIEMVKLTDGHARLRDPPSRSSAWRENFKTPPDYNDSEGFCGGFERQWLVNNGKCGICGDAFDEMIKPHEAPGGVFATGIIVRKYRQRQTIPVKIEITARHKGFYEFKLCPNNNVLQDPTQACFDRFPLSFISVEGIISKKIFVESVPQGTYSAELILPPKVTCSQCIIQWTYVTGNRWGNCPNGTGKIGCGPQETFRACSDVAIFSSKEILSTTMEPLPATESTTAKSLSTTLPPPTTVVTPCESFVPSPSQEATPGMTDWCNKNCSDGNCPSDFCVCSEGQ